MDKLTKNMVNTLLEWGADLVGIAPMERFANAPEGHKPTDFLAECKSVISVGLHIFQGMADVWGEYDEPGRTITPYLFYGYGLTNIESSRILNRMATAYAAAIISVFLSATYTLDHDQTLGVDQPFIGFCDLVLQLE